MRYASEKLILVSTSHNALIAAAVAWALVACSGDRFESTAPVCDEGDPSCASDTDPAPSPGGDPPGSDTDAAPGPAETDETDVTPSGTDAPSPSETDATDPEPGAGTDEPGPVETDITDEPTESDEVTCEPPSSGRLRAYFEIPETADAELGDYFRLPFPNDFYLDQGQPRLGDFPAETAAVEAFIDAVEQHADGFSASPTIIFRFSGRIDFSTLTERFQLLDITDPASVSSPPLKLLYSPSAGKYVCHNALSVRPSPGHALVSGHTYAAIIDKGVLSNEALEVSPSPQLQAMLAAEAPADPIALELHEKFAPLRAYLDVEGKPPSDILNATVFTVGDVREPMARLASDVAELAVPTASMWTLCDGATTSPCRDATAGRACGEPNELYYEYHALVELPVFQQGDAPYFNAGGEISYAGPVRSEQVCVALTVPKDTPPAGGFPLLLTSHGAGGSFRSHITAAVAERLTQGHPVDDAIVNFAVLGYDGVQHGPRRGNDSLTSSIDPDILLFNFLNPAGTLGTSLQGGIDVLTMSRFAKDLAEQVPASLGIELNTERLVLWGHSQGAMQAAIALPYTDDVHAAVFSGLGAGFLQTMLARTEPDFIPQTVAQAIFDPGPDGQPVFGGQFHPALALVQHLIDPVDTLHHAERLVSEPVTQPLHVFQVYGARDAYSPAVAQQSFAIAAKLGLAPTDPAAQSPEEFVELMPSAEFPLVGNLASEGGLWTAGVRQYTPADGANGHFVAFEVPAATDDVAHFLATAVTRDQPSLGR